MIRREIQTIVLASAYGLIFSAIYVAITVLLVGCQTVPPPDEATGGAIDSVYTVLLVAVLVLQILGNAGIIQTSRQNKAVLNGNGQEERLQRLLDLLEADRDGD